MQSIAPSQSFGTVTFDNAFRGVDPLFEQALAYHARQAIHTTPRHLDRIAAAVAICQQGRIQVRASAVLARDGSMLYETAAAKVKMCEGALKDYYSTSDRCTCGHSNGSVGWPCAHAYSVILYQAAIRSTEQAHYEAAVA